MKIRLTVALAASVAAGIPPATAATQVHIGAWILACPDAGGCVLRLAKRLLDQAGATADVEILSQDGRLVPVMVLHGLPQEVLITAAMAGKAEASLALGPVTESLACGLAGGGIVCAPAGSAAARLAAALPAAKSARARLVLSVNGAAPLPPQSRSLDLTGAAEAVAKLRAAGAAEVPPPDMAASVAVLAAQSPGAVSGVADRMLKAAGYAGGLADLPGILAKYWRK